MSRLAGFSSVFLAIILSCCVLAELLFVETASSKAASKISEGLCLVAGRSVLSEYNKELYDRYGLFAMYRDEQYMSDKAEFYINASLIVKKGVIQLCTDEICVDASRYAFSNENELKRQIEALSLNMDEYILSVCSNKLKKDDLASRKLETEYVLYGEQKDEDNELWVRAELFSARFALDLAHIYADPLLLGEARSAAYAIFSEGGEAAVFAVASVQASEQAVREVDDLLQGQNVPVFEIEGVEAFGEYEDYLRAFLLIEKQEKKLKRLQSIIESDISGIMNQEFKLSDYVYGFDINVGFIKKASAFGIGITRRKKDISESFCYL